MKLFTAHVMLVVTRQRRGGRMRREVRYSRRLALVASDEESARAKVVEWLASETSNRELMAIEFGSGRMDAVDVQLATDRDNAAQDRLADIMGGGGWSDSIRDPRALAWVLVRSRYDAAVKALEKAPYRTNAEMERSW